MGGLLSLFRSKKFEITSPSKGAGDAKQGEPQEYSYETPFESETIKSQVDEKPSLTAEEISHSPQPDAAEVPTSQQEEDKADQEASASSETEQQLEPENAQEQQETGKKEEEVEDGAAEAEGPDVEGAVVKIQAGIRGYLTRKVMKQKKDDAESGKQKVDAEGQSETSESVQVEESAPTPEPVTEDSAPAEEKAKSVGESASQPPSRASSAHTEGVQGEVETEAKESTSPTAPLSPSNTPEENKSIVTVNIEPPTPETVSYEDGQQFSSESSEIRSASPIANEEGATTPAKSVTPSPEDEDEEPPRSSPSPVGDPENAAVKIQSVFRGYRTRKQLSESPTTEIPKNSSGGHPLAEAHGEEAEEEAPRSTTPQIEIDDIPQDPGTPDTDVAAVKIQAAFRGYKVRKEIRSREVSPAPRGTSDSPLPEDGAGQEEESSEKGEANSRPASADQEADKEPATRESSAKSAANSVDGTSNDPAISQNDERPPSSRGASGRSEGAVDGEIKNSAESNESGVTSDKEDADVQANGTASETDSIKQSVTEDLQKESNLEDRGSAKSSKPSSAQKEPSVEKVEA